MIQKVSIVIVNMSNENKKISKLDSEMEGTLFVTSNTDNLKEYSVKLNVIAVSKESINNLVFKN